MSADPDAGAWRLRATEIRDDAANMLAGIFGRIDAGLAAGDRHAQVAVMFAEYDLSQGVPLAHVIGELLVTETRTRWP